MHDLIALLNQHRTALGVSKRSHATALDLAWPVYVKLLMGKHAPSMATCLTLAHALRLPLAQILHLAGYDLGIPYRLLAAASDVELLAAVDYLWSLSSAERRAVLNHQPPRSG